MRLIHNMTTIAECPAPESSLSNRVIKMAVIGGSGVGKTGENTHAEPRCSSLLKSQLQKKKLNLFSAELVVNCCPSLFAALVVRFLTKRFIGDYERNAGDYLRNDRHPYTERNQTCETGC